MRLLLILSLCLLCSCTTIRFNEREHLLQFDMRFDPDPLQAKIDGHARDPRQASAGVFSSGGGGGCGCY